MIAYLFSIPLGVYKIGPLLPDEKDVLSNLEYHKNTGNHTSLNHNILNDFEHLSIREPIKEKLTDFFENVWKPGPEVTVHYTQSWMNKTFPGEFHHRHHHPNSLISGVYWVHTHNDTLTFINPMQKYLQILPTEHNLFNSDEWVVNAEEGTLVLFPSHIDHYVRGKEGDEPRISLAFNSWLKGTIGNPMSLTGLVL